MKFISFNINSIRARIHQIQAIIERYQPDIIGLQETKVHDELFPLEALNPFGYHIIYHGQKAHYGVALMSKLPPQNIQKGLPDDDELAQRRLIMADYPTPAGIITVINGYFPQGDNRNHEIKFPAKAKFYHNLYRFLEDKLSPERLVIIMGDMNICPTDNDIGIGEENRKNWLKMGKCSFLPEERAWLQRILDWGLVDTYRQHYLDINNQFSWFDYRSKGFLNNRGLRIDLILASKPLARYCIETGIAYDIRAMEKPSDHAPIWAKFNFNHI